MLQVFYFDVSKRDLKEAHAAVGHRAAMGHHARLLVLLPLHAYGHVKRSGLRVVPHMRGPRGLRSRTGAGTRELGVSGAGARAPFDASVPDMTSRRLPRSMLFYPEF
jgi:hypothetical protein